MLEFKSDIKDLDNTQKSTNSNTEILISDNIQDQSTKTKKFYFFGYFRDFFSQVLEFISKNMETIDKIILIILMNFFYSILFFIDHYSCYDFEFKILYYVLLNFAEVFANYPFKEKYKGLSIFLKLVRNMLAYGILMIYPLFMIKTEAKLLKFQIFWIVLFVICSVFDLYDNKTEENDSWIIFIRKMKYRISFILWLYGFSNSFSYNYIFLPLLLGISFILQSRLVIKEKNRNYLLDPNVCMNFDLINLCCFLIITMLNEDRLSKIQLIPNN